MVYDSFVHEPRKLKEETVEKMGKSVKACPAWAKGTLIVGSLLAYVLAVVLNAVLNIPGISPFNTTIGQVSDKYKTPITPSDVTFGIWGFIYFWQLVLVIYCLTLMCRKLNNKPLYISPGVVPSIFFVSYIINLTGNPGWIVVWLEEKLVFGFVLLVLAVVTLVICLISSCKELEESGAALESNGLKADIWCTRIIVQNGIAFYLAWVSCATAINGVVVLYYVLGTSLAESCFIALISLSVFLVGWFILEIVYDRQLRYVFSHYITYLVAFYGIYVKNFDPEISYEVYALVLLFVVAGLTLVKVIIIIVRSIKDPIHYPQTKDKVKFYPSESDIIAVQY